MASVAKSSRTPGVMMILSPAKTLDLSSPVISSSSAPPPPPTTSPSCDATKTKDIAVAMKKRTKGELQKLLGISANLAETAHQYWKDFQVDSSKRKSTEMKPCLFAFSGAAYQGLQARSLDDEAVTYLQSNLRIVDPLYGLLRPLDVIQPYRLEMATRGVFADDKKTKIKLADYWKTSVTGALTEELDSRTKILQTTTAEEDESAAANSNSSSATTSKTILVNLASEEYAAAVDPSNLPSHTAYVKIIFWEKGRVVSSVHAKRARGLMAQYLAEEKVTNLSGIQAFNREGYKFSPNNSDETTTLVFDRSLIDPTKKRAATTGGTKQQTGTTGRAKKARKR